MFTGIIQTIGKVIEITNESLTILSKDVIEDLDVSDSISISGTCLTVIEKNLENSTFKVNVIPETLKRTNLGYLSNNSKVNLETSALLGGKLGGHLVQGHIDCTSEISSISKERNSYNVSIKTPKQISQYLVEKGYIALDGTSLTIVEIDDEKFTVSIIPFTWENTIFKYSEPTKLVNVEVDLTAKYIENFYKFNKWFFHILLTSCELLIII